MTQLNNLKLIEQYKLEQVLNFQTWKPKTDKVIKLNLKKKKNGIS